MTQKNKNRIISLVSVLVFLLIWEIAAGIINSPVVLPHFRLVFEQFFLQLGTPLFWHSLGGTFGRVLLAFAVSLFTGTILGFASGLSPDFRAFLKFPLSLIKATPVVALVMVMLFWFPSENLPVICAFLMTLPVITESVSKAIQNSDKKLTEMAEVFDFSFSSKIFYLYFPQIRPYLKGTSKTVFALCWKVVAAGEILSLPRNALGTLIQDNRILLEPASVFSLVIALILVCLLSEKAIFLFFKVMGVARNRLRRFRAGSFAAPASASEPAVSDSPSVCQTAPAPDAKISIQNLSFSYKNDSDGTGQEIFKDLSLEFQSGKITSISGANGRGKTTLLKILSGLIPPSEYSGTVICPKVSFIFQEDRLIPGITVLQNIVLPLFSRMTHKEAYRKAFGFLEKSGLQDKAFAYPETLSGGEKQKIQAARAFAFENPVLLIDEGTSSLDENSRREFWETVRNLLEKSPRTVLFVSHNPEEAQKFSDISTYL